MRLVASVAVFLGVGLLFVNVLHVNVVLTWVVGALAGFLILQIWKR